MIHKTSISLSLLAALGAAPRLQSQQPGATLPAGFLQSGGNAPDGRGTGTSFIFDAPRMRYLERHAAWTGGSQRVLNGMALRRPWGQPAAPRATARTMDISLHLGLAQGTTLGAGSFSNNFVGNSRQQVFSQRAVQLPDRSAPATQIPAAWDLRLPFSRPHIYTAAADFLWEVECSNSSAVSGTRYYCDRADDSSFLRSDARQQGAGCGGQSLAARFYNYGPQGKTYQMRLYLDADQHPANTTVTVALGLQTLAVSLPGWCAPVHPDPLVYLPLGNTDALGQLPGRYLNQAYLPALEGLRLQLQSFAADSTVAVGVALSGGMELWVPPAPGPRAQGFAFVYQTSTGGSLKGPYTSGSVITGWF